VVYLRGDVLWHDGTPFSSADVAYTIGILQDPAFPGPAELGAFWRTVEFDILDNLTVRFKLAQPLATFPDSLRIGILPEHVLRGTSAERLRTHPFNLAPIGTGPYQFDSLLGDGARLRGLRLARAATHAGRAGQETANYALQTINLRCYPAWPDALAAFQRGEVSSISEVPAEAVEQIKALPLLPLPVHQPALGAVIFNWGRDSVKFFQDARFRRALAYSTDRIGLVDAYLKNRAVPAESPILPNSWAFARDVQCPTYDSNAPNAARDSLAQVQTTPDPSIGYRFELLVSNDAALANLAAGMADSWRALGIAVDVVVVDAVTFRERLASASFDAALVELNLAPLADPDPYSLWRQRPADGGLNFGGMNDRRISELLETSRRAANGGYRVELYRQFQQAFCDKAAALVLYYPVYYYGIDSRLGGVQLGFLSNPSDRFRTLQNWAFAP
jgi:peptide/nickel transport system substrate-binding protein